MHNLPSRTKLLPIGAVQCRCLVKNNRTISAKLLILAAGRMLFLLLCLNLKKKHVKAIDFILMPNRYVFLQLINSMFKIVSSSIVLMSMSRIYSLHI